MKLKWKSYDRELPALEWVIYHVSNILSMGAVWGVKIVIKKAIAEAMQDSEKRNAKTR